MIKSWGMPTLVEFKSVEENVRLCHELGLDFIELNMNLPQFQPEVIDVDLLNRLKETYGVSYTIHLPEVMDMTQFNQRLRDAHVELFKDVIELAVKIDAKVLNMHMTPGIHFKLPDRKVDLYEVYHELYLDHFKSFVTSIGTYIEETGITLNIENTGISDYAFIVEATNQLLETDFIKLTWDVGHDYVAKMIDWPLIHKHRLKVTHMHLHDARGLKCHLGLFDGDIDIESCLSFASEVNASVVLETKTIEALKTSVQKLKERGLK